MDSIEATRGMLDALLDGYARMRALVVKAASAPEVVLEKVASVNVPERATAARASGVVDALVKRGFVSSDERESLIRSFCTSDPNSLCAYLEKFASMASPLEPNFDERLEDRVGESSPSECPKGAIHSWVAAGKSTKK